MPSILARVVLAPLFLQSCSAALPELSDSGYSHVTAILCTCAYFEFYAQSSSVFISQADDIYKFNKWTHYSTVQ